MATAGTLEYIISVDSSSVSGGLSSAEGKVKGFGNKLSSWAVAKGQVLGNLITKVGKATVDFVKDSVKESMGFDKAMSQVAATLGKSTGEVQDLAKFAREMGSKTAFTATEAAEALNYMALAGYDAEKSMKMLPLVLNLAAAGNMDLAKASDMVTDAQSALGLSMEETEALVDKMAKTASKSNTSVEQLGDAILTVGGTAKIMESGMIDTTTELSMALGVLADNGIKGSEGGTMLRNVLLSLTAGTDKAKKQLKDLGVSAFDAQGNMRDLPEIMQDLNEAMSGKSTEERENILNTIFNKRDLKAVEALLGTSKDRWGELMLEIMGAKGAAQEMADTQLDNLDGDVTKLKSAISEAKLTIVEGLTPALRKMAQKGITYVNRLTDAFKKNGLKGAFEEAGNIIDEVVTTLKTSDSPVLQLVGKGLETVKNIGTEVFGLITDFPGKLKEWKESDSPGLNALADVFGTLGEAVTTIETAFNEGLPAAIEHLKEVDTPLSNLAAGALETLKSFCEFLVGHADIGGIVEGLAIGFAALKGIEISGSLITFISKLSSIKNAGQLNQLLKGLQNGDLTGGGNTTTPTHVPAGTATKSSLFAKASTFIGSRLSLLAAGGGLAPFALLAALGGLGYAGASMINANLNDVNLNKIFGSNNGMGKNEDTVVDTMSEEAIKAAKAYWDVYQDTGSEAAMDARDKLFSILEGEGYENTELGVGLIENIFDNILNENDQDGLGARLQERFNQVDLSAPVKPTLGDASGLQASLKGLGLTVTVTPKMADIGYNQFGKAKGDWNVPYDNYPSLLHRGEMVLTASQARKYRDGETGSTSEVVGAIQSLKNTMSNLQLVVGKKVFGKTVVSYGGSGMSNYIGRASSRLDAGYGT